MLKLQRRSNVIDGVPVHDFTVIVSRPLAGFIPLVNVPFIEERTIRVFEAGRASSVSSTPSAELSDGAHWQSVVAAAATFRPKVFFSERFDPPTSSYTWGLWGPGWIWLGRWVAALGLGVIGLMALYKSAVRTRVEQRPRAIQAGRCGRCGYALGSPLAMCPECGEQFNPASNPPSAVPPDPR